MTTPRSMSDVVLEGETTVPDKFNPCITDTFLDVPSAEIVVVPWKVFQVFPEIMHPNFSIDQGEITYDGDVNIFMSDHNLKPSTHGYLEDFTQTWVVPISTAEELDVVTVRLSSYPSLLSVKLTARNILEDSIEIPMVIFLSPDSQCIRDLIGKLGKAKENFSSSKKFSVEVDIGPSMAKWGKQVLRREFLSVGGRFVITSGAIFNHVFDWNNILGCVPCLPCGLIGSSVYRIHRKINYTDEVLNDIVGIAILGAKGMAFSNQRHAVFLLMQWIRVFMLYYCTECRLRVPLTEAMKSSKRFCKCENRPKSSLSLGVTSPLGATERYAEIFGRLHDHPGSSRTDSGLASPQTSRDPASEGAANNIPGSSDDTRQDGDSNERNVNSKQGDDAAAGLGDAGAGAGTGAGAGAGAGNVSGGPKDQTATSNRHKSAKKKGERGMADKNGRFDPYKHDVAGTAIERKKWMVTQNPSVTKTEWETSMNVLNTKRPGGYVPMRTRFKYPKQKAKKPGRRPTSSGFVEIELKNVEDKEKEDIQADAETSEMTMVNEEIRKHGDSDEEDVDEDEDFYFVQDGTDEHFDDDPLGQIDLKTFLVKISDPKTGTLNPGFSGRKAKPVTRQPDARRESVA